MKQIYNYKVLVIEMIDKNINTLLIKLSIKEKIEFNIKRKLS
jgi:hypothetical protein